MPGGLEFLDWAGTTGGFTGIGIRRHAHEFRSPRRLLLAVRYDRLAHPHPYTLMLPQHHTERLLREAAAATGTPHARRGRWPGRWRLVYRIGPGEDRESMATEEAAVGLLAQTLPDARIHRFPWASAFRLEQGQSATYRQGRWLLVGAHLPAVTGRMARSEALLHLSPVAGTTAPPALHEPPDRRRSGHRGGRVDGADRSAG